MSNAVLDRILAIPDYDDRPQMGLTTKEWAIIEKTGKTKDGKAAKPSVLSQDRSKTLIKGDKKLSELSESPKPVFRELDSSIAKKVKGAIADQRSINSSGRRSGKSNTQKSDQAYQLHEKTKQSHEKARDKFIGLSDELGALRDKAQEAKGKVETGRTKKRASEMKDAFKFNNALEAEAMNNGQAVPVMRQKANKKQMASINDKINQKENEMFAAQSRTNQLKARANKLFDASQDYSNKNDATPSKSRKVIKGKSPRDRGSKSQNTPIAPDTAKKIKAAIAGVKGGKVVRGKSPRDRGSKPNQESTPQKTPYEVAKEFGVKSTVTGNVKRINAKTKPELIEKALEHHFAQEKASRYLSASKKSGLPQYQNLDEKTVRGFAAKVFAGYVTPNLQDFNGMTNGGGSDFSGYVKAGLLKDVQSDRGQRHPLTSVGREFAKEIMASKSKGEFADQAKAAINPKPKQQSPTAKKLNLTAAKEAEILKSIKRF